MRNEQDKSLHGAAIRLVRWRGVCADGGNHLQIFCGKEK
jgi:hypothetical protein